MVLEKSINHVNDKTPCLNEDRSLPPSFLPSFLPSLPPSLSPSLPPSLVVDGHGSNGSARGSGNSRILAEPMSNLLINDYGVNLDSCNEDIAKYAENLNSEIAKTSSDAVIQKLAEDTSQKLNHIRDRLHSYCLS